MTCHGVLNNVGKYLHYVMQTNFLTVCCMCQTSHLMFPSHSQMLPCPPVNSGAGKCTSYRSAKIHMEALNNVSSYCFRCELRFYFWIDQVLLFIGLHDNFSCKLTKYALYFIVCKSVSFRMENASDLKLGDSTSFAILWLLWADLYTYASNLGTVF